MAQEDKMPIIKQDLDTHFIVVDGDKTAGLALNELLHKTWLVVKTTDPGTGQPVMRVVLATALTHVMEGTPVDQIAFGNLATKTLPSNMDLDDARARANAEKDVCFIVLDANGQPLGALSPEADLMPRRPTGQIEVQCPHCGKWVFVPSGPPGTRTCPIYGHTFQL
jgi:hypothetical protein